MASLQLAVVEESCEWWSDVKNVCLRVWVFEKGCVKRSM